MTHTVGCDCQFRGRITVKSICDFYNNCFTHEVLAGRFVWVKADSEIFEFQKYTCFQISKIFTSSSIFICGFILRN